MTRGDRAVSLPLWSAGKILVTRQSVDSIDTSSRVCGAGGNRNFEMLDEVRGGITGGRRDELPIPYK